MSSPYGAPPPPYDVRTSAPPPVDPALVEWFREYRQPRGTIVLLGIIGLVFVAQLVIGHGDSIAALDWMGVLRGADVRRGAVWELFSAAFLHVGIIHIAMNGLALFSIGRLLEPAIGWRRVYIAFFLSAAAGNAFACLSSIPSAGASGGIWGLFTLVAAVVIRRPDVFPGQMAARLRPGLFRALLINAAISFIPGVSWLAHLGGGVTGAVLGLSGAMTFNVLRFPVPTSRPLWLTLVSVGLTLLAVACVVFAAIAGVIVRARGA